MCQISAMPIHQLQTKEMTNIVHPGPDIWMFLLGPRILSCPVSDSVGCLSDGYLITPVCQGWYVVNEILNEHSCCVVCIALKYAHDELVKETPSDQMATHWLALARGVSACIHIIMHITWVCPRPGLGHSLDLQTHNKRRQNVQRPKPTLTGAAAGRLLVCCYAYEAIFGAKNKQHQLEKG